MPQVSVKPAAVPGVGEQRESRSKAWGITLVLVLLYIINYGDKVVLGLVAQPLKDELGLTASQIGLAGSVFFLAFTVGGFFAGLINKWVTLRWALALLALAWAACMLPMVVAAGFAVLLVSRFALGLMEGPASALIYTATYSWHPMEKRSLPGACIGSAASLSKIAIAPALALAIVVWGWRAAFIVMAVVGVVWCVIWLLTWSEGPHGERRDAGPAASGDPQQPRKVGWTSIFRTPTFLGGVAAAFAMYALLSVVLTWLPSYFEVGLGYTRLQAGTMFGFPSIAALVTMFGSSFISDRLMSRGASARIVRGVLPGTGLLLCGLALVTLPYIGTPALVVVVVSVGYGMGSMIFPLLFAAISQICPKPQLAGTLGVFMAVMSLGGIIGPYLTGKIVDAAASPAAGYAHAFQVFGAIAVVGAVLALLAVNPERDACRVHKAQD